MVELHHIEFLRKKFNETGNLTKKEIKLLLELSEQLATNYVQKNKSQEIEEKSVE